MTWKDVLDEDEDNPYQYLTFEPHFHLFFSAPRASFDYSVAEAIEAQSGWLFHRITKGETRTSRWRISTISFTSSPTASVTLAFERSASR